VLGGAPGLNYAHDFREVDGILVAMKRRVYDFDTDKCKMPYPVLVAIDIHEIAFS
jgi:electron transfer flavoprotein alpha/beta subunit